MGGGTFLLTLTVRQLDEHTPKKKFTTFEIFGNRQPLAASSSVHVWGLNKAVLPVFHLNKKSSLQRHFRCFIEMFDKLIKMSISAGSY